jgi:hypothetical protein
VDQLHALLLAELHAADQIDWSRAAADGSHVRAKRRLCVSSGRFEDGFTCRRCSYARSASSTTVCIGSVHGRGRSSGARRVAQEGDPQTERQRRRGRNRGQGRNRCAQQRADGHEQQAPVPAAQQPPKRALGRRWQP